MKVLYALIASSLSLLLVACGGNSGIFPSSSALTIANTAVLPNYKSLKALYVVYTDHVGVQVLDSGGYKVQATIINGLARPPAAAAEPNNIISFV
ncbi:MAG: hypothetical protein JOZ77_05180 [Candidatus Eremiobacteraeota bacterium]|nr:hypothetical protein [Candidatus Eremiobacteraeota bacterium]